MQKYIIVNATALGGSGALTILKQFIHSVPDDEHIYVVFISSSVEIVSEHSNINLIRKDVKSLKRRFFWDIFGIKKWLKENGIVPSATVSLQNTNFITHKGIPNFIYYHNSIPFFDAYWNPFRPEERELWFYKVIYPFFVKLFLNRETEIFVQLKHVKNSFSYYFNFPKDRIHVINPSIVLKLSDEIDIDFLDKQQLNLFYPAIPFKYKNHEVIIRALNMLNENIKNRITLHLTCHESELLHVSHGNIKINFLGNVSFNNMLKFYQSSDALLFPSYIETFGLPLIEAAFFGMKIIASDLPYSREVLEYYEGVSFVPYNDAEAWKVEISKLFQLNGKRFKSHTFRRSGSWEELFRIIKNKIQGDV